MINIKKIDPSPYQHRKYFDENSLKELGASILTPLERMHKLLSKLDSIRRSRERGSVVSEAEKNLSNKFIGQVETIFKNLPKPLKWQSFLMNDLSLLTDIPLKVQKASVQYDLNKAQTKALARLEQVSDKVFCDVTKKKW